MALASQNLPFTLTLTLTTEQRPGRFTLTWDTGSYSLEFRPETDVTLGDLLRRLQPVLAGGRDSSEKLAPAELLQVVGTQLWQALFPATAPVDKREALAHELRTGTTPLHLALPPKLAVLPWELLCDPLHLDDAWFLACRRPLTRLIPGGIDLPPLTPPLRVLLLISSPPGLEEGQRIDVESERAAVESATRESREAGFLHLQVEDIVTPRGVQQLLLRYEPHILHYIGHGGYNKDDSGYLVWEDDRGEPIPMPDTRLADLLRSRGLRAVLLHGCKTASSHSRTEFRSVAGTLLAAGIPAVLAQQASFTYESSQRASEMFYTALTSGSGLAEATFEARQALAQAERPDWAVPILQATLSGLTPFLDASAPSGSPDPALASSGAAADLPAPTGVFVGRQRELRALRSMLESPPGTGPVLAMITGPGGVGKSTLAAQAIARYGGYYMATLTLSCVSYQGLDLFLQRIGEFLQQQGVPGLLEHTLPDPKLGMTAKIEESIGALNQAGPFLLIIDNLESVQQKDDTLADPDLLHLLQKLLTHLRGGRVLVTGRYSVEGLLPAGTFAVNVVRLDLDDLGSYEIHQLLTRQPMLEQIGDTVREELVREFGGLPYIYDLLSSKAATENLADFIHDAQGRITLERQKHSASEWEQIHRQVIEFAALEATIARLPEQARTLLRRLSIFRRPFPQEALEQGLGAAHFDWQPLLDWTLLYHNSADGTYRLHSLTAHYAEGLLDASDRTTTQIQVAEWYLRYAQEESKDLADVLEAHHLIRAAGEVKRAGEIANGLVNMLDRLGLYQLWHKLCKLTIDDAHGLRDNIVAEALHQLGIIAQRQGQYEQAKRLFGESLTTFEQLGNLRGRVNTLGELGIIAQMQGEYEQARYFLGESLVIFKQLGNLREQSISLGYLGAIAQDQGQYEEAKRLYRESLTISEQLGDREGHAVALSQLVHNHATSSTMERGGS
jgi:tetratricopeptide (TPR) repeat protein